MPRIELINVTKRWGNFVGVANLNMVIEDRDFVTLLGPSGCGKTTTLRMIAGLETPTEGIIKIGDTVVFDAEKGINISPAKRDVGFLFQNYALWPHMTVYQNIAFGLENLKWNKEDIKVRVAEMLKMLKIEEFVNRYPAELSGGQQQRVAIARTLAPKPKVLFMDEPLSNLDAKLRTEMRTELKRLHVDTDSTFVYVTHDQLEAMTLSTNVCLMKAGYLQQYAPPLTIYNEPVNLFVADFMGNPPMNFVPGKITDVGKGNFKVEFAGLNAKFNIEGDVEMPEYEEEVTDAEGNKSKRTVKVDDLNGREVVVGIRPEYLSIEEEGIDTTVYSTLPAGMETTVKLKLNDAIITGVVFGSVDYAVNTPLKIKFNGNKIILFDRESTKRIAFGSLKM